MKLNDAKFSCVFGDVFKDLVLICFDVLDIGKVFFDGGDDGE